MTYEKAVLKLFQEKCRYITLNGEKVRGNNGRCVYLHDRHRTLECKGKFSEEDYKREDWICKQ